MKANIGLVVASIVITFLIAEGCLRLSGWQEAHYGLEKYLPTIKPSSFLVKDELLGWKLGVGKFDFFYGDTLYSSCKVNIKTTISERFLCTDAPIHLVSRFQTPLIIHSTYK
jgi:hypothetical protein